MKKQANEALINIPVLRKLLDILSRYGFQIDDKYAPILDGTSELYTPRKD